MTAVAIYIAPVARRADATVVEQVAEAAADGAVVDPVHCIPAISGDGVILPVEMDRGEYSAWDSRDGREVAAVVCGVVEYTWTLQGGEISC